MATPLGEKLSALRREHRLTQKKAAAGLGISQGLLSLYENGAREPGLEFVSRACDFYGVTADQILGRERLPAESEATAELRALAVELRALADRVDEKLAAYRGRTAAPREKEEA